jgi:hypothetical protein
MLAMLGCAPGKGTVQGRVMYHNGPLPVGTVTFFCANNHVISAEIRPDGSYQAVDVPAGNVFVTVATPPPAPPLPVPANKPPPIQDPNYPREMLPGPPKKTVPIPKRYADPKQSGLATSVEKGTRTTFDIQLED